MAETLPSWETHDVESLRPFSKVRLVAVDIDGTLVGPKSPNLHQMIAGLQRSLGHSRHQVRLTIATGRTLHGASAVLSQLPVAKGTPLILYNGSVVVSGDGKTVIEKKVIPNNVCAHVIEVATRFQAVSYAYFFDDPWLTIGGDNEYVLAWSESTGPERDSNGMSINWQVDRLKEDLTPSAMLIDVRGFTNSGFLIAEELTQIAEITLTTSGAGFIEIRPCGSNKGEALKTVAKRLSLNNDEVLALGDNDNDAEMLKWAGIGVSIHNSTLLALESSNYVCDCGAVEGAIQVLRLVKQARRFYFQPPWRRL